MIVEIRLFASLSQYRPHPLISAKGFIELQVPNNVGNIVDKLDIPRHEIQLIFLNGVRAHMDNEIKDGDRLGLFPPIGGG